MAPIPSVEASPNGNWLTGWSYRLNGTITSTNDEDLTNYPVLLTIDTSSLISEGKMQPDGEDIIVTDSDGTTQLKHWISEGLNTEETKIWVKVPTISASSSQDLHLYYGNTNYQAPPTDVEWEYQLRTLEKAGSGWDDTGIRQIDAYYNESTGRLHVWYGGYDGTNWQVGYAYTDNLAAEFTRGGNNPTIPLGSSGEFDDTHIRDPSGIKIGNTFYIYYQSHDGVGWHGLGLAHVSDTDPSAVCTKDGEVLDISAGTYDSKMVASPAACIDDSTIYVFYEAIDDSDKVSIAYATGSTSDPTSLTKQDQIKHANGSVIYNIWGDTMSLVPTTLIKVNQVWYMGFHYGRTSGVAGKIWRGWLKATTFPTNWEWCSENPMFRQGETEGWCINWHSSPEILRIGGVYHLYIERANEEFSEENGRIILYKGIAYGAGCDVFNVYNSFLLNGTTDEWTTYQCDINRTHDARAKYGKTSFWVNATVDNDPGYAKLDFATQIENRSVAVHFYDDGTTWDNYWVRCDDGTTVAVIGVSADEYITHYAYRVGSTWYDTGTSRLAGWHKTEFVYRDGRVYLYLDDVALADFDDPDTFDLVYLSYSKNLTEEWYDKLIVRYYYDPEPTTSMTVPVLSNDEVRITNIEADNYVYTEEKYYYFQAKYSHPTDVNDFDTTKIAFSDLYDALALDFNGVGDWVSISDDDSLDIVSSLTVMFWFKTPISLGGQNNWACFIQKYKEAESYAPYAIGVSNEGLIYFQLYHGSGLTRLDLTGFNPTPGVWYHLSAVYDDDDNEMRVYINGESNASRTASLGPIVASNGNLRIGIGTSTFLQASIDEVQLYNRSLSQTEISYNKDHYAPYDEFGLRGLWHMDEGVGSSIYDTSGNENGGSISGADWVQSNPLVDPHWVIVSFDAIDNVWALESGGDIVDMESGENRTSGTQLIVTFHIWFKDTIFDAQSRDILMWCNDTSGVYDEWETGAQDYFHIYHLGGEAEITISGSNAGRVIGGDVFEIYAEGVQGNWCKASQTWRHLQSVHMLVSLYVDQPCIDAAGAYPASDLADTYTGYYEFGVDYYHGGVWEGWKCRIEYDDAIIHVGLSTHAWVELNITWWYKDQAIITNDLMYAFFEGIEGENNVVKVWVDFWFNKVNGSSVIGGRINAYHHGMEDGDYLFWTGCHPMISNTTQSMFFQDLTDSKGEIFSSREIELMRLYAVVNKTDASCDHRFELRDYDIFEIKTAKGEMEGVDTPVLVATKIPNWAGVQLGFLYPIYLGILRIADVVSHAITMGALTAWSYLVGFLDTVFTVVGWPNGFSQIMSWITQFFAWLVTSISYAVTLVTSTFALMATYLPMILINFVSIVTGFISIFDYLLWIWDTASYGAASLSEVITPFLGLLPIAVFIWILSSRDIEHMAQKVKMLWDLLNSAIGFLLKIADFTISLITRLIEAIPVAE